ncbi:MAG TPA: peptidylprolyl isomerase [Pararhizobium sp.]|nr:peptidylprolyl isomerase [Pararhizobium sp.]
MKIGLKSLRALVICAAVLSTATTLPLLARPADAANSVQIVVDGQPITSYDISHRVNFLRLQHKKGDLKKMAKDQLIEQKLKTIAINRAHAAVPMSEVKASYARFAQTNHLTTAKLTDILNRAGVGPDHFKDYIRVQMSWQRLLAARGGSDSRDLVSKMLEKGEAKPTTTEYVLQQVIFVIPDGKRGSILGTRKRQAEAMRRRFQNCDTTRDFAAKLHDVAVRDLGRIMQPQLPTDWKSDIEKTPAGKATPIHVTKRGVEFIGVCSSEKVSDDLAAATVFKAEREDNGAGEAESKKLLDQLRKHATITYH